MSTNTRWTEKNIPDQSGRVAIVTGANSGIGYETARALAQKGATVIMACRSQQKAQTAAEQIRGGNPSGSVEVMQLDLSDLDNVSAFAAAFKDLYNRLDLLINNAGIMMPPYTKSKQGFEIQWGVNHLGHFALTAHLFDLVSQTPDSRIVTVSSTAHNMGQINFDDLNSEQNYSPQRAYGQSKLANLLFTYELQRKLDSAGLDVLATAAHPGWTATNLQRHAGFFERLNPIVAQSPPMGALPTLYAAIAPGIKGGTFYGPGGLMEMRGYPKQVKSNARSQDQAVAARLWTVSEEMTGVAFPVGAATLA